MNDFSEEYDFMQRIHKIDGQGKNDYTLKEGIKKKDEEGHFGREKLEKDFYLKSKYDKYSSTLSGFEKDDKFLYMNRLKNENEKDMKKRESSSNRSSINELAKVNEVVYYIHANKKNVYEYITNQTDLENTYYQIEEKPRNISGNLVKENEEYVYLNDNAYYKFKIMKDDKEDEEGEKGIGEANEKLKYTLDGSKNVIIENMIESDNMLLHLCNTFFSVKDWVKNILIFLSKIFHFNFLDYTYIKNYSLTNYFDKNVKDYMKYLKKNEDLRLINNDFLARRKYIPPYFVYNCVDCNYNTNDNGIIILSSILPFIHRFDYDYKLRQMRTKEEELDNILNSEKGRKGGGDGGIGSRLLDSIRRIRNFFFGNLFEENSSGNNVGGGYGDGGTAASNNTSEYTEFLKKFENSINEEGELIQDILFSGKAQMIFINFKQIENNFNNVIGNVEIKNERVQVSNLILGYEKREHIKYTDILISNILKNIKKKYPDMVINDENPRQFIYEENEFSDKYAPNGEENFHHDYSPLSNKDGEATMTDSVDMHMKKEHYMLSDLKEYVYNAPSHLMKDKRNNCEYVTCVCFDNNSNNCNLINNFVLGYNTGKVEYIYGKIVYSNISHCDLLIDYYSKKNKKFSYELSKRIFLNGAVIKVAFAPNGFFCLVLTSKTLYICNFFYFSIYEIPNICFKSHFVNFLWINNNSYSVFTDNGNVYLYEKSLKNDGVNSFSLMKTFCVQQPIYLNSICEYHLYSNCIYLYTGEIEKRRRSKNGSHHLFKKKKKRNKHMSDYFYKYDCNFVIIDLNADVWRGVSGCGEGGISARVNEDGLIGGVNLLKDNMSDLENNMKQIKILERLIENGNNLDEEDVNLENMLHINIKDFNNYISTIKDGNNHLYSGESGEEANMVRRDNSKGEFSMKKLLINYIKDVKKHLYNLKDENIINILLPRYYSTGDDYSHRNFLNIRFFTIEKSDNKHLIALDTETDYVYIYKIRKNVYLDDEALEMLKNNPYSVNNNPLHMFYANYLKRESCLKEEWKIYNDYIYVNTKKMKKYIKYNLLYIIKNHKKMFFPLHVYVINTKFNESEYFLFIKWATIKNTFIYASYSSLNRVTKMKEYFRKDDEKLLKVLEHPKNIFLYNINDKGGDLPYLPRLNGFGHPPHLLDPRGKFIGKEHLAENVIHGNGALGMNNHLLYNKGRIHEYRDNVGNPIKGFNPYTGNNEDYLNKTPLKNVGRNFYTSPIDQMSANMAYPFKGGPKYSDKDMYTDYYMNSSVKEPDYGNFSNYGDYLNESTRKQNESDKKWSYLRKINIFNKKDEDINENSYMNTRHTYNHHADSKHMQQHTGGGHMLNLDNDDPILGDMKKGNFYSSPERFRYKRLHDPADSSKILNDDHTNMSDFYYRHNAGRYHSNSIGSDNYDPYALKNDMYNYRNMNMDLNGNSATHNVNAHGDMYRGPNDGSYFASDVDKSTGGKGRNVYSNRDINDVNPVYSDKEYRNRYKNFQFER
ncbi:conserved Plasmodium protein, unknown function [Plasmodium knowlesi strain H]|uniref:Uncharacterized protein n=3 Tax=Plasmodium knowlesi TaxID=5850 RepID=A0A5K1U1I1_PLAKH|nr:conserved Plasmodium protein, unknown function [Plasmodium knowlesi strain H]OTN66208.1 Uncharacterized protein PKNOH_S09550300 [Plasmodium knowlesi]CAA9989811.1 conserved Plasmodium protein, unknown function [Plasmodium knowlesi strain H]SBO24355.1 conserved Plasmodium protein, unknown function [Plasmodium knowlesi strain H]SBO26686.1 conserved Plasmodium protein, unknown function [Plasmodium knowlesi strain H]VVS79285.1 conserved Plasmodium protein, unknown function [Plasmodium knowlesi s|eukprot:XP_002259826.1 hypothetical protein, conserved in Plasmodium species [Plasmodium knowlesi strain H]